MARIAVIQYAPKIGHVSENISRATALCADLEPGSVDLVCLPEMVFSGYVFRDASHIAPYLETPRKGPTSVFCSLLADRLRCYVLAGYPEKIDPAERPKMRPWTIGYNSAVLYGPGGIFVGNYRKTNLYDTDMSWAEPGAGFATFNLPAPLGRLSLGICMDLNAQPPAVWTLEEGPYELAEHCLSTRSRVLVVLNAWLDSLEDEDAETDWSTLNYWAARLRPLWRNRGSVLAQAVTPSQPHAEHVTVIICNRSGKESGIKFAGSSALFQMHPGVGKPRLVDAMSRREEGIRVWDT
ncbi:carbon-nitrogen hydrolase [Punctularia strigosozonata HHB-11173 SS5]|uniref:carbon-nitrogen hydrolase n=1 Tax=Punctularia strigosozonata (strain HHB-11173) TaxID=741275 RepID=UPI00044184B2|nr:carbon-nitrogen hydrolase [Punctularia strigosozonata HHB-11173 SS5]EIN12801.1 carbon-nitrogen hydrolase [Punctularia strigosozonata HHB-11173 SS5]